MLLPLPVWGAGTSQNLHCHESSEPQSQTAELASQRFHPIIAIPPSLPGGVSLCWQDLMSLFTMSLHADNDAGETYTPTTMRAGQAAIRAHAQVGAWAASPAHVGSLAS